MRISSINNCDLINVIGGGIAVSVWVQGCSVRCEGCFNKSTWDYDGGHRYEEVIDGFLEALSSKYINQVSFLGGNPTDAFHFDDVVMMARIARIVRPDIKINIWSGIDIEFLDDEKLSAFDNLIGGPYKRSLPKTHSWAGSSNQRLYSRSVDGVWTDISDEYGKI